MAPEELTDLIRQSLFIAMEVSAPLLLILLLIGFGLSIFQSITQMSEMTLIFIPKIFCFALTFALIVPWIMKVLTRFTYDLLTHHWSNIMNLTINGF
jgi:flagellar biosynthetic protein FliQ